MDAPAFLVRPRLVACFVVVTTVTLGFLLTVQHTKAINQQNYDSLLSMVSVKEFFTPELTENDNYLFKVEKGPVHLRSEKYHLGVFNRSTGEVTEHDNGVEFEISETGTTTICIMKPLGRSGMADQVLQIFYVTIPFNFSGEKNTI
jgi:hypothetical protein